MTLIGVILTTIITHGALFDTPTMGIGQIMLPSEAACISAADDMKRRRIDAFCTPVYDK